jgi:hypothetical protein
VLDTGACALELHHQFGFGRKPQTPGSAVTAATR